MTTHTQFTRTIDKNQLIYAQTWEITSPRGVVLLVHGLGEHTGRYQYLAEILNRNSYTVVGFDLPGHGRSSGKRGHISSYETAMKVIEYFLNYCKGRYPNIPVFLYGHSMGGALVLYYALTRRPGMHGLVVTSPLLAPPQSYPPIKLFAGKILAKVYPSFIMQNGLDVAGLSRDQTVVDNYVKDPLVSSGISAALGIESINCGKWMQNQKPRLPFPFLLMQGTSDHIINYQAVKNFAEKVEGDFTYKEWDHFFHELHNEPEKEEVLEYVVNWMNNTIK